MGYASRSGRARTSVRDPRAFSVCDRCGFWYNHHTLQFQHEWAGASLVSRQKLVCRSCLDTPQQQLRAIILPADPVPIWQPRPEDFVTAESNVRATSGQDTVDARTGIPVPGNVLRTTQDNNFRTTQQTGEPPKGLNQLPGTNPNAPGNSSPGLPLENLIVPATGPLDSSPALPPFFNAPVLATSDGFTLVTDAGEAIAVD